MSRNRKKLQSDPYRACESGGVLPYISSVRLGEMTADREGVMWGDK
ncbi:MAG: hypothetical protein KDD67_00630 [Ignavibacteriae bacterium]|nr:hypothetical protein [Ignavibacteriota bacterium]